VSDEPLIIGAERVALGFTTASSQAVALIHASVARLGALLQRKVMGEKLTDQVLHVRTGRLRRSINLRLDDEGNQVTASVGTNVEYARVHELGFSGTVNVPQHSRKSHMRRVEGKKKRKRIAAAEVVRAHQRRMHIRPRPFLGPSLAEMAPAIQQEFATLAERIARGAGA
jgi:phage gpG-like protein